jgi:predicted RNA binding protein YcfA (HicA-like mRNA interferase family)
MDKVDKIINKFRNSDAGHRFEDCEKVILYLGYELKRVSGSHHQYQKAAHTYTIARHKPVARGAIKEILKLWEKHND